MNEPISAGCSPMRCTLQPGTHLYCACGRSSTQPFCDGSHEGTGISPVPFTVAEATELSLCLCKRTANPPYCDGTHKTLPPADPA